MKSNPDCDHVRPLLEDHFYGDLAAAESRAVAAHLAACPGCTGEAERARAAIELVAPLREIDLPAELDDERLRGMRRRVMAAVAAAAPPAPSWLGLRWALPLGAAAALLVVALIAGVRPGTAPASVEVSRAQPAPAAAAPGAPVAGDEIGIVTVASADGVTLRWEGDGDAEGEGQNAAYLVLKSNRPASFDRAQTTLVCGKSWTDRSGASGVAFYQVVRVRENCHI